VVRAARAARRSEKSTGPLTARSSVSALGHVHVLRDDRGRLDDTLGVEIPLQQRQVHRAIMPDEQR